MEAPEQRPTEQEPDDESRTPPHGDELFDREDAEPADDDEE
jgi:hypothetical protein